MKQQIKNLLKLFFLLILVVPTATKVDAHIPVGYTCCYNYTYSDGVKLANFENNPLNGTQLENFDNLSNWTVGGAVGAADIADTINFKEGIQGIKLIAMYGNSTTYNRTYIDKSINNNFSTANNFGVWVYVYNVSTFDHGIIYFSSTSDWSRYFTGFMTSLQPGWNKIILSQNGFKQGNISNPENWNNVMIRTRIAIYPTNGQNTNVTFDDLRYNVVNDWALGGTNDSLTADTVNFKEGKQGLKLTATATGSCITGSCSFIDISINNNFSTTNNFAIWTYVDNASNFSGIIIYLTSTGGNWNKYFYDSNWGVETGWNKLVFNRHSFINIGGEDWNNVMNKIRLRLLPRADTNVSLTFDDLRNDTMGQRAKLMIEFDDGYLGTYTKAYPILSANNQTGVSFFITSWVGYPNMNLSNLKSLQSDGWDISSHTVDHPDLATLNDSVLTNELNDSYAWLVNNGFQKSAGFIAYPYGSFNGVVIDKVKKTYILGRADNKYSESAQQHFTSNDPIQYIQKTVSQSNNTPVQSVMDNVNDTINAKLLGILLFHNINDTNSANDPYTYLTSDLKNISDYIKSRSADVDVLTYSDYVIPNINIFTPVINKTTRIFSNGTAILVTKNKYDEYMPNMTVKPSSGSIDIGITTYDETGGLIKFNESSPDSNVQVSYNIGDRIPNQLYNVKIYWANGTKYQDFNILANSTGYISYSSTGFGYSRFQQISAQVIDTSFTITLPIGYTFLRFNASNSTVTNLNPDGQNSVQPEFNITNNGNIIQNFRFYLNGTITNITTYVDLDNNHSVGKIEINKSSTIVVSNLNPGSMQNVWIIVDANRAPATNTNKTLTINSS